MTKIRADETELVGKWVSEGGRIVADDTAQRIHELINSYLEKITHDASGWKTLYRDPLDGRFWELIYPQSHLHGGGPPELHVVSAEQADEKYALNKRNEPLTEKD